MPYGVYGIYGPQIGVGEVVVPPAPEPEPIRTPVGYGKTTFAAFVDLFNISEFSILLCIVYDYCSHGF